MQETVKNRNILVLYFIPAFLYCLYNNFSFVNLSTFDPTTYYILLQLRVVVTAIVFQVSSQKVIANSSCTLIVFSGDIQETTEQETMDIASATNKWLHVKTSKLYQRYLQSSNSS